MSSKVAVSFNLCNGGGAGVDLVIKVIQGHLSGGGAAYAASRKLGEKLLSDVDDDLNMCGDVQMQGSTAFS